MQECNHYLWYFYEYEWIKEVHFDSELKYDQWTWFLDKRRNWWHLFTYCPECGWKINRIEMLKEIKINYKNLCKSL